MSKLGSLLSGKSKTNEDPAERLKKDLQNAQTLEDFFTICGKHYDLPGTKLGVITRATLINNIDKLIAASGAKPKTK